MIAKPSRVDRLEAKQKAKTKKLSARQQTYRLVDLRDQMRCRACGAKGTPYTVEWNKLHHHHIRYLSLGGDDQTANICLLCALCHAAVHDRRLGIGGNANETLRFSGVASGKDGSWTS